MNTRLYWWNEFGSFQPRNAKEQYPDPSQVTLHFRLLRGMTRHELAQELGISSSMACHMEKENIGLDSITRCRKLAWLLDIPAFLFGLDSLHHTPEAGWWEKEGYSPFDTGSDTYPLIGQVIKYYRVLKLRQAQQVRNHDSGEEKWTQYGLAVALGVSDFTVRKMENNHKGLDSITRRQALAFFLNIPPVLLGLDSLSHPLAVEPELSVYSHLTRPRPIVLGTETLGKYRTTLESTWKTYYSSHGQDAIGRALREIKQLQDVVSLTRGKQQNQVIEIQSLYHQFILNVVREQQNFDSAIAHVDCAISLAKYIGNDELTSTAVIRRGMAHLSQGNLVIATIDANEALLFAKHARPQVKGHVLLDAGLIYAHQADSSTGVRTALELLDQAEHIARSGNFDEDDYFLKFNPGIYHIGRARALLALGYSNGQLKKEKLQEALGEFELAEQLTNANMTRRRALIDLFRAQTHFKLGEFSFAASEALQDLDAFKKVESRLNIARITEIYHLLRASSYGNAPLVLRLRWVLGRLGQ